MQIEYIPLYFCKKINNDFSISKQNPHIQDKGQSYAFTDVSMYKTLYILYAWVNRRNNCVHKIKIES